MRRLTAFHPVVGLLVLAMAAMPAVAHAELLFESSLKSGDYGAAQKIDTFAPNQGGSPHVLGIVDGPDGATYTSTEANGQSNALINWTLSSDQALAFRMAGTVSFCLRVDRAALVNGWILGDNYGFTAFNNGQGSFGSAISRRDNGTPDDPADDQWGLSFSSWHSAVWYFRPATQPPLDFGPWYRIGYTWGGPDHTFEEWADGTLISSDDRPELILPWGSYNSAANVGLGDNHQRGIDGYGSAAGVSFADVRLWTDARPFGDSTASCAVCGNGFVEAGEACDDGNTAAGDCCDATCQFEATGSPCADDGVACSADACDGAGACAHTPLDASCDDTNPCTQDTCSVPGGCAYVPAASSCDDGDACTVDACDAGSCDGVLANISGLLCRVDELPLACASALPKSLAKRVAGRVRKTHTLATKLERAVARNQAKKVLALRGALANGLATVPKWTAKAVQSTDPRKQIAPECRDAIDGKVSEVRASIGTLVL